MGFLDGQPTEIEAILSGRVGSIHPDLAGPVRLVSTARRGGDALRCDVSAHRLIRLDPAGSPQGDVWVALPVSGWIELRADGSLGGSSLPPPDPDAVEEARLFARDLIAQGAVRGLSPGSGAGPGRRATHELQTDSEGRRVLRRVGYSLR